MRNTTRLKSESALFLLVLAAILIVANVRSDTSRAKLFSLSTGSKRLASSLKDQMEIRAYFSKDLPTPFNALPRYVRDLLTEYRDASGGKITLRIIEPATDKEKQEAEADGIDKVQDQRLEQDSFKIQEDYRGLSFHYLGNTKQLKHIDTTEGLEYTITQMIKEL